MKIKRYPRQKKVGYLISTYLLFGSLALHASDGNDAKGANDRFMAELSVLSSSFMQRVAATMCRKDEDLVAVIKAQEQQYCQGKSSYARQWMEQDIHKKYYKCEQLAQWQPYSACIARRVYRDIKKCQSYRQYYRNKKEAHYFESMFKDISRLVVERLKTYQLALERAHDAKALTQLQSDFDVILRTNVLVLVLLEKHFERKAKRSVQTRLNGIPVEG